MLLRQCRGDGSWWSPCDVLVVLLWCVIVVLMHQCRGVGSWWPPCDVLRWCVNAVVVCRGGRRYALQLPLSDLHFPRLSLASCCSGSHDTAALAGPTSPQHHMPHTTPATHAAASTRFIPHATLQHAALCTCHRMSHCSVCHITVYASPHCGTCHNSAHATLQFMHHHTATHATIQRTPHCNLCPPTLRNMPHFSARYTAVYVTSQFSFLCSTFSTVTQNITCIFPFPIFFVVEPD